MKTKQITLSILVFLSVFTTRAQEPNISFILNQSETGSTKQYLASDRVTLKSGFVYNAAQGKTFTAKIDKTLPLPANSSTYKDASGNVTTDPQGSAIVGAVSGSAAVTPTGAATYQIPIEVPTGIAGMQPQVAVVYNSQGGFGNLGTGWDIAGTSAITRGGKNLYFDNVNSTIKFDTSDQLYLDGQRLILLSGTHFSVNAEYGTEIENHVRVKILNGANGIYFQATSVDGKVMEFGNSTNSMLKNAGDANDTRVMAWKLNKVSDLYSNYMTYTYTQYGQYLQRIDYTGNGTTQTPQKSVVFTYNETLSVPKISFLTTFKIQHNKLLSGICTYSGTTKLKDYRFGYVAAGVDKHLDNVSEFARDGSKLYATKVNWGTVDPVQQITVNPIVSDYFNLPADKGSLYYADLNGDGYNDRIEMYVGSATRDRNGNIISTTDGNFRAYLFNPNSNSFEDWSFIQSFEYHDHELFKPRIIICDYDNNMKQDVVLINGGMIELYSLYSAGVNDFQKVGSTIDVGVDLQNFIYDIYPNNVSRNYDVTPTDCNGDGFVDLVFTFPYKSPSQKFSAQLNPGFKVFYGNASGFQTTTSQGFYSNSSFKRYAIGDFNADSKLDYVGLPTTNTNTNFYTDNPITFTVNSIWGNNLEEEDLIIPFDYNADGFTDLLVQQFDDHSWKILKNNGGYHIAPTVIATTGIHTAYNKYSEERYNIYPLDYNGDGYVDLILGDETFEKDNWFDSPDFIRTTWYFYKNCGSYYSEEKVITSTTDRIHEISGAVTDINHDGVADLVLPVGSYLKAFTKPNANRASLVTGLTDGMGRSVSYGYANNTNVCTDATTISDVQNLNAPLLVANSITNVDGKAITYTYEKAKVHTRGKGMLGFGVVTVKNQTDNAQISTEYEINSTYYGVSQKSQTVKDYSGTSTLSTSTQTNDVKVVDAARKRYIPTVTAQTTTDNVKNLTQSSSAVFDNFGNATTQTTIAGDDNDKITTIVETDYKVRTGGTVEYLPETVTTTRKKSGESDVIRTATYDYNDNGKLIKETKDPADLNKLVTEYKDFDTWGHPCTVVDSISGKPVRKSTMAYTPSGYFVASKTNHLLETTYYVWDEALGLLKTETDHWSRATTYSYDAWNKPLMVSYPEGYRKGTAVQWAAGAVPGAAYYTYEETKGSSPVWTWYNTLGQEVRKDYYGLNEKKICVSTEYNAKKQVYRVSDPYFETESAGKTWAATYTYDSYGRPQTVTTSREVSTMAYNARVESVSRTVTGEATPFFTSSKELNSAGLLKISTENGKSVNFTYYPSGLAKTTTPQGGQALSMEYNLQGQRKKLVDPDAGEVLTTYNGFGELTEEKQKVHNSQYIVTTNNYNDNGTLNTIVRNGETTTYSYDSEHIGRPSSISIVDKNTQYFGYDYFDRLEYVYETIGDREYYTYYGYDMYGRETYKTYPSYYEVYNTYDKYGNLTEVKDGSNRPIWKAVAENARGQIMQERKGNYDTYYGFDERGLPGYISDGNAVDMYYSFDNKGNLQYRADNMYGNDESFVYDSHDRLTNWNVTAEWGNYSKNNTIVYDPNTGTISSKTDIGTLFKYGTVNNEQGAVNPNPGPHALTSVTGPLTSLQSQALNVTYTDFKKIKTLSEGNKYYELTYGIDDQRRKSEYKINNQTQLTRYYLGDYEEEVDALGNVKQIHYLSGAIMIITNYDTQQLYYSYTNYQGSLIALTDENGTVVERYAYDPWGARRNPDNWTESDTRTSWIVNRGYTGHEHLDAFGIINMNGRVYDPLTAMFFSPDPYVQEPDKWLNYNRYGYCFGNPLKYTDPSGEWIHLLIGAVIGGVINWAAHGAEFTWKGLGYFGVGALAGALGAGIAGGISSTLAVAGKTAGGFAAGFWGTSAATTATSSFVSGAAIGAGSGATGGFVNGFGNALVDGNNFGDALGKGALGGLMGGIGGGLIGGLVGGIDAAIDGRTFWGGGTIEREGLAYDWSYDWYYGSDVTNTTQNGDYGCVDKAIDNISSSKGLRVKGSDIRNAISPGSDPSKTPLMDGDAFAEYAKRVGAKSNGLSNPSRTIMNDGYEMIKNGGKVVVTYPSGTMNHAVNLQGAFKQTISYPNGLVKSKIIYIVLNNGKKAIMPAANLSGNGVNVFNLIFP